jgi:hypothetical protein
MDDPRAELERALALEHETERKLAVAAVFDGQVRDLGFRAIVIGGVAVEFWTHGAYTTADIDLYLPHGPAVDERLAVLGFEREGRHWVHREHELFVEAPASFPAPNEEVTEIDLSNGMTALVLAPEDVTIDRLHQFVAGGHSDVAEQAIALVQSRDVDSVRLAGRAREEGLVQALTEIERMAQRLRRGESIALHEFQDAAKRLRRPGVD